MVNDEEGFWYPEVDKTKCVECDMCVKACPIIVKIRNVKKNDTEKNLQLEQIYQKQKAYACYYINEEIRQYSSSGGLFTVLAELVINAGGVVFGASFDDAFNVVHSHVEIQDGLAKFRGSKYVQSRIVDTYVQAENFLSQGRPVLYTGTPCQIGGLKSYLRREYENLLNIDIICHGVPSPMIWQRYLSFRENQEKDKIQAISFRNKKRGWSKYSLSLLYASGKEYNESVDDDLYLVGFQKNLFLRPSCYACSFKTLKRESDITLADCWGVEDFAPEIDDGRGTSLVIINTDRGQAFFDRVQCKLKVKKVDFAQAISHQPAYFLSMDANPRKSIFFKKIAEEEIDKLIADNCRNSNIAMLKRKLKTLVKGVLKSAGLRKV
jgi:coenzyme F420-reducing hydrogenase beta subunit